VFAEGGVARRGEPVRAAAPAAHGLPVAVDQPGTLQSVQRWVDGSGRQVERSAAARPQRFDDRVAMPRARFEGCQQQRVQVAFQQLRPHRRHHPPFPVAYVDM
jgi:hypothetical protein